MIILLSIIILLYIVLKVLHKVYPNSMNHQKTFHLKSNKKSDNEKESI
jgi:hypothetical protein